MIKEAILNVSESSLRQGDLLGASDHRFQTFDRVVALNAA
jgi:hypothetical protein